MPSTTVASAGAELADLLGVAEGGNEVGASTSGAGIEREHDERAEHNEDRRARYECDLHDCLQVSRFRIVIDEGAHAVCTVNEGEPEHEHIPPLPERVGPLATDEPKVDGLDTVTHHEVRKKMPEDKNKQDDSGYPHVHPAPFFEVDAVAAGGACGTAGSLDSRHVQALLAEDVDEVAGKEAEHGNNPQPDDDIKQGSLVPGRPEPKVNEDDPDAVKRVKYDRGHKRCLAKTHDRGLVRADDGVIRLWAYPNQRCVEHMNEEEEEDCDAGNAVQNP